MFGKPQLPMSAVQVDDLKQIVESALNARPHYAPHTTTATTITINIGEIHVHAGQPIEVEQLLVEMRAALNSLTAPRPTALATPAPATYTLPAGAGDRFDNSAPYNTHCVRCGEIVPWSQHIAAEGADYHRKCLTAKNARSSQ